MKKHLFKVLCISLLILYSQNSYSQLQIESSGQTESRSKVEKKATYIHKIEDGYYFWVADYLTAKYGLYGENYTVKLYLGKNSAEINQSADVLSKWFDEAKNDAYIYVTNANGQRVCLYKYNANMYLSYGNEQNCKALRVTYGADMAAALTGVSYKHEDQRKQLMSNIEFGDYVLSALTPFKKEFLRSIQNFHEPGAISKSTKNEIMAEMNEIRTLYKQRDLLDSQIFVSFKEIAQTYMKSDQETEWIVLKNLINEMKLLAKPKNATILADLINELSTSDNINNKIAIFEKYSTAL